MRVLVPEEAPRGEGERAGGDEGGRDVDDGAEGYDALRDAERAEEDRHRAERAERRLDGAHLGAVDHVDVLLLELEQPDVEAVEPEARHHDEAEEGERRRRERRVVRARRRRAADAADGVRGGGAEDGGGEDPEVAEARACLLYTSPSPRDQRGSRMPSSA